MNTLEGKVTLITGAKGGLGSLITEAFLAAGATVVGVSRSIQASDFSHPRFTALPAGPSSGAAARKVADDIAAQLGRIDVLVLDKMLDLNYRSAFFMARAVLPHMRRHEDRRSSFHFRTPCASESRRRFLTPEDNAGISLACPRRSAVAGYLGRAFSITPTISSTHLSSPFPKPIRSILSTPSASTIQLRGMLNSETSFATYPLAGRTGKVYLFSVRNGRIRPGLSSVFSVMTK